MRFRPCIDIHNGKVKQIVGGSLKDQGDAAKENFVSEMSAADYAALYQKDGFAGGHVILLNPPSSEYYASTKAQALAALRQYPNGLQIGGGITADNAAEFLQAGAGHVIVTSYVFRGGEVLYEHLRKLVDAVGKEHVVLDLSCRKKGEDFFIVTDRWQTFTDIRVTPEILRELSSYCDEYLIHGVDVEGHACGVDADLMRLLADYAGADGAIPVTYAGGIGSLADLKRFEKLTDGKVDFTIGSALDLFGGNLPYDELKCYREGDV